MATVEGQRAIMLLLLLLALAQMSLTSSSPPPDPVACADGASNCTITNAYASYPDRRTCHAAKAAYPRTEQELVAAVAAAVAAKRKVKVATRYGHSFTKLACPGGNAGAIISTRWLNRTVRVDARNRLITVESGMTLRGLISAAAEAGLALPYTPYWFGLTVGGLLGTGAHGNSLWGKGGAVHEYVVALRIVTPAPASHGFAMVRELGTGHPDLDAAKVSLGVLGVISQVTLRLQPMFKRSISFVKRDDTDLAEQVATWGRIHEFGDITWLPEERKVIYRQDDRVDVSAPGDGFNDNLGFRPFSATELEADRVQDDLLQENGTDATRCTAIRTAEAYLESHAFGLTNDGVNFTGYPVVGYQHRMQASGSCLDTKDDGLKSVCYWDPRIRGPFIYNTGLSVPLSRAPAFVADLKRLRDRNPQAFCVLGTSGVLMRYVKASTAYLGKPVDSLTVDIDYYRSHASGTPRAHADMIDEIEQMALHKYGGLPHWGKNRNFAFHGAIAKFPRAGEFLKVKHRYDPEGTFSSEWSDQVLGIKGQSTNILNMGCAMEGLCVCSDDSHCAPEKGYHCRPGKVYAEARVCAR
ncbi:L-gulonolactone oxidase 2-like [Panicum miliaceum]|uniref:L-gulonolactone oxidase n=1 Tax=Panicum miliaceum TaxID=4540 RepID=A0A3L6RL73_PANMI|nr:L-gulonolactone oxidase 2-like [Panicum miliaceum]